VRDIIVKPARCAGLPIDDRLVRRLTSETGQEPGSLPLLAFALRQLFDRREGTALTEQVYEELGGLSGAIRVHAQTVEDKIAELKSIDDKDVSRGCFHPGCRHHR
jgi:hypothetical protein